MAITGKPGRTWVPGAVACLALLGSVTGALGGEASAASRSPSAAAAGGAAIPAPGQESVLYAVSCTSSASCWAVGKYQNANGASVDQAMHWNGRAWSLVTAPGDSSTVKNSLTALFAVSCITPASCWAVGIREGRDRSEHDQVLHWNGRRWSLVTVPDPSTAGGFGGLNGVRCTAPTSCWAVGTFSKNGTAPGLNLILHWNGRRWSLVSTPNPGGTATGDINELIGVRCTSPASCWAVGDYGTSPFIGGTDLNQALHWNGRKWSVVATPDPDGTGSGANNLLIDIACTSPASCWAVGGYGIIRRGGVQLNQALHWNERRWSLIATPDPGGTATGDSDILSGIRCTSAASCWAVGDSQQVGGADVNQALHWNGSRWSAR